MGWATVSGVNRVRPYRVLGQRLGHRVGLLLAAEDYDGPDMGSGAGTIEKYLDSPEPDRREVVSAVRDVINEALPKGDVEGIASGMIGWAVPLEPFPDMYDRQPLSYIGLAAQKRYYSLYLNAVHTGSVQEVEFRRRWEAIGCKLDMGKSCVRFRKLDDLDLDLVSEGDPGYLGVRDWNQEVSSPACHCPR